MLHIAVFALAAAAAPQQAESLLRSGLLELQQNRPAEALKDLEGASRADPQNAVVWASLAQTYLRLDQKERAFQAAQTAEKLGGGRDVIAHLLSIFYGEAG